MNLHSTHRLQPIPGYLYLARPAPPSLTALSDSLPSPLFADATPSPDRAPHHPVPSPHARQAPVAAPDKADLARLLIVWLEALDGRRSPATLKSVRFHPHVPATLPSLRQRLQLGTLTDRADAASMLNTVHIQQAATHKTRFCASVVIRGRVRALAGTGRLVRVRKHKESPAAVVWRVETLHII
ncbi:hypothetical protein GSS87_06755 [Corynebacterium sp. 4HC-13]|uniref:Rv3235 family protein n=1 Tax=Corynebacterium anserum TaxID=2684406 RepID=UPI00163AC2FF|nr:Rv3235 family protein [Corynebacterium anserum]MBC2682093.1 hypothetical protein [Corynebacterium anserum]